MSENNLWTLPFITDRFERVERDINEVASTMRRHETELAEFRLVVTDLRDLANFARESRESIQRIAKVTQFAMSKKSWAFLMAGFFVLQWLSERVPPIHVPWR